MFHPNWSAKVEYLYYDLGTASAANVLSAAVPAATRFTAPITRLRPISTATSPASA